MAYLDHPTKLGELFSKLILVSEHTDLELEYALSVA